MDSTTIAALGAFLIIVTIIIVVSVIHYNQVSPQNILSFCTKINDSHTLYIYDRSDCDNLSLDKKGWHFDSLSNGYVIYKR